MAATLPTIYPQGLLKMETKSSHGVLYLCVFRGDVGTPSKTIEYAQWRDQISEIPMPLSLWLHTVTDERNVHKKTIGLLNIKYVQRNGVPSVFPRVSEGDSLFYVLDISCGMDSGSSPRLGSH